MPNQNAETGAYNWYFLGLLTLIYVMGSIDRSVISVIAELKTTFACHFSKEISLFAALLPENVAAYCESKTGEKFLINPIRG
jgi:hypothetical protein